MARQWASFEHHFDIPPNVDSIASDGELFNWRIVERDESTKPLSSVSNAEK